ncbi:MAG: Cof-type HAD-IIB family hydrolase [Bacillota bacterium]
MSSRPEPPAVRLRLAAFDLDGTLLGPDLSLSRRVTDAVRRLRGAGVTPVVVTGRMHRTAERFALELGLEGLPVVSFNGAMARPAGGGEPWWYDPLDSGLAVEVVTFLTGRGLDPLVFADDCLYAGPAGEHIEVYARISGVRPVLTGDLAARIAGTSGEPALRPAKILQVRDEGAMPELHREALERFGEVLNVTTSYPFFLEFMRRDVGKGPALARLCRRLGVAAREVVAFGDGLNDLDMIRWAGLGVAMSHGPEILRASADRVIAGPPGEGVARFIEESLLGVRPREAR